MKLTEEQKRSVQEKLSYFISHSCEVCNGREWVLNDTIFETREFNGGNLVIGGQSGIFPLITVSCKNCGRSHFFNAILLGVITK